jgi:hypothetical protein
MSTEDTFGAPGRWAVVRELTAVCLELVDGGVFDDAAIAVGAPDQAPLVLAASTSRARSMLEWETVCGQGAAWEAWRVRGAASVRDLADPTVGRHWPAYAAGAAERQVRAAAAVPLAVGSSVLGVLAGFASTPVEFGADQLAFLGAAALRATTSVLDACSMAEAERIDDDDQGAGLVQARVHQAVGMVAARYAVEIDDALALLRARSFAANVSLDVVAADVVAGRDIVVRS